MAGSLTSPQEVARCLLDQRNPAHNIAALEHRQRLIRSWGIPLGSKVLEIGPGQGDFTVALADAIGPSGRIVAVDTAPPGYGKATKRPAPSLPPFKGGKGEGERVFLGTPAIPPWGQ